MVQGMTPEVRRGAIGWLADVGAVRLENGGWDSFASLSCGDLEAEQQDRVVPGVMTGAPGAIRTVLLDIMWVIGVSGRGQRGAPQATFPAGLSTT